MVAVQIDFLREYPTLNGVDTLKSKSVAYASTLLELVKRRIPNSGVSKN